MKIKNLLVGLSLGSGLLAGMYWLHAQDATTFSQAGAASLNNTNVDWNSLSDLEVELKAIEAMPTVSVTNLPDQGMDGTFYSAQYLNIWPPLPGDVLGLPVWEVDTNLFLIDDTNFDYAAAQAKAAKTAGGMQVMDEGSGGGFSPDFSFPSNALWLQINGVSNGLVYLTLNNTTNGVEYQIISQEALSNAPLSSWNVEGPLFWGSATTNWTATTVAQNGRSNLFLSAQSQIDSTGTGIPDWWWLLYYGQDTNVNAYADPAGDGWNNLEKFQLGMNPNVFYTPPAPQELTANYNSYNTTATVSWQPSPGPVTGYTVEKDDSYSDTVQDFNIPADENYLVDNVATNLYDSDLGQTLSVSYKVQALYSTNGSYWGGPVPLQQNTLSASFIAGPQGSAYVAVSSVPAGTVALQVSRFDEDAWFNDQFGGNAPYFTNFDISISASTNGLYLIPSSWVVMQPDAYGDSYAYDWSVQTLNTNGIPNASGSIYRGYNFYTEDDRAWLVPPYFDGRAQLKQNLIFLLRAGVVDSPFDYIDIGYFYGTNNNDYYTYFSNPANYAYAGFYQLDENANNGGYFETGGSFDVYWPFENNYRYRNFVFNSSELDVNGRTTTGAGGNYYQNYVFGSYFPGGLMMQYPPTYQFQAPATNGASIPPLLATNQTQWLVSYALDSAANYLDEIGVTTNGSGTYSMASNARNIYGLPFLSANIGFNAGGGAGVTTLYAGNNTTQGGYFYPQTAQPQFQTVEYDFWPVKPSPYDYSGSVLPGMTNFSTGQPSDLLITSVGNPNFAVDGYAKLAVPNGYSGVYGYLGQYFDQAYQIDDNGNVTTNTTGVLSSYGQFFATQPSPAALVTMPDPDTGAQGTCTVYCISLALDANHDGTINTNFDGPDGTSQANPYVFWANNNFDRWDTIETPLFTETEQDDVPPGDPNSSGQDYDPNDPDCNYHDLNGDRVIPDTRDLEDFARLWVCGITPGLVSNLPPGSTITLSWGDIGNPNSSNPTIDVFQSVEGDGGIGYLTNETVANEQLGSSLYVGRIGPGVGIQKPAYTFGNGYGLNHLIWCGVSNGVGQLTMTIADGNGNPLAQASQWIQIVDIKQMYERWTVGDAPSQPPTTTPVPAADDLPTNVMQQPFLYSTNTIPGTPYILFVHGWNVSLYDKDREAETAFKRLYWQGYHGRFGSFQWPTTVQNLNLRAFDNGEYQAWQSGVGLLDLLSSLDAEYQSGNVYLMAHSQGNVAAGEALRLATQQGLGQVVNTYVAMQTAVDSHTYDPTTPTRSVTFSTPDRYGQYYTNGAPSYFNGSAGAGTYVNFFNTNDWALAANIWQRDQNEKPDIGYGYDGTNFFYQPFLTRTYLYFPEDTYDIFSYCDQAHGYALGAQPNVGGAFKTGVIYHQVELDADPYDFGTAHIYHSGEFRSDYAQRWQFWNEVLLQMRLAP